MDEPDMAKTTFLAARMRLRPSPKAYSEAITTWPGDWAHASLAEEAPRAPTDIASPPCRRNRRRETARLARCLSAMAGLLVARATGWGVWGQLQQTSGGVAGDPAEPPRLRG